MYPRKYKFVLNKRSTTHFIRNFKRIVSNLLKIKENGMGNPVEKILNFIKGDFNSF